MKQFVLMNSKGDLGLGVRIQFFDNVVREGEAGKLADNFDIVIRESGHDGWLVFNGGPEDSHPWIYVNKDFVDGRLEILGEL